MYQRNLLLLKLKYLNIQIRLLIFLCFLFDISSFKTVQDWNVITDTHMKTKFEYIYLLMRLCSVLNIQYGWLSISQTKHKVLEHQH